MVTHAIYVNCFTLRPWLRVKQLPQHPTITSPSHIFQELIFLITVLQCRSHDTGTYGYRHVVRILAFLSDTAALHL